MVEYDLGPHGVQQLIEAFGGKALEKGVGVPFAAHTVHNIAAVTVGVHHAVHGVDIVLTVTVDGDGDVAAALGLHQPGQHGVLVAAVAALADADIVRIARGQLVDDLPCAVLGAVIHKQDPAVRADFACSGQIGELLQEHRRGDGQNLLLVVAGDDDIQDGTGAVIHSIKPQNIMVAGSGVTGRPRAAAPGQVA